MKVTLEDILKAQTILKDVVRLTPLEKSMAASKLIGSEVFLKQENLQLIGSFKLRGAYNKIYHLTAAEKKKGVVASSAGNHAQGVAFSAAKMGVSSTLVMPKTAPMVKVEATRSYGAHVVLHGDYYDEAYEHARVLEKEQGMVFVHPYEDPHVIAGQGTIGLEIFQQAADLDSVVVSIGGGGYIAGIATALKAKNPKIKVYGVQAEASRGMEQMYHNKKIQISSQSTIADGIAVKKPSKVMYDSFIKKLVDEVAVVTEDEISEAIVFLLESSKLVVEGAAAAAFAGACGKQFKLGKKTCVVLGGGNIDLNIIAKVIEKGLIKKGRLVELSVLVDDVPGQLSNLTKAIADLGGNILEVFHDRLSEGLYLRETKIKFLIETRNMEHIEEVRKSLARTGARLV
jgi:threonine dehydratase